MTYTQAIFDAVPLIFCNGAKDTGKSTVGEVLAELCYNGVTLSNSSAAALVRLTDASQGSFINLDLEKIGGSNGTRDGQFDELIQVLKTSYKKSTAKKAVYDGKAGRTKTLNFFGVKVASNTTGVDSILGSRMFRIQTRKIPQHLLEGANPVKVGRVMKESAHALQQHLHTWAFDNVADVEDKYREVLPYSNDRDEEIAGPVRAIAALVGPEFAKRVEAALARQSKARMEEEDDDTIIEAAAAALVLEGYNSFPAALVAMMGALMVGDTHGMTYSGEIPLWKQTKYITTHLINVNIFKDSKAPVRPRLWEGGPQLRTYEVEEMFVEKVAAAHDIEVEEMVLRRRPLTAWCHKCDTCPYAGVCDAVSQLKSQKESWDRKVARGTLFAPEVVRDRDLDGKGRSLI